MTEAARPARALLRRSRHGVLSSLSVRFPGHPHGSAVPFATGARGHPVILVSNLAAHTQNLHADSRVSLTVHEDDVVEGSRCTVLARAEALAQDNAAARRYLERFPAGADFLALGDFHFFRLDPVAVHFIGGFGDIRWLDGAAFLLPELPAETAEADILAHMNKDHIPALKHYCCTRTGTEPGQVRMIAADAEGFDVMADGLPLRFEFPDLAQTAEAIRLHLVRIARTGRAPG